MQDYVSFTINGKSHNVSSSSVRIDTTLNTFIRVHAGLPGTKFMCLEGGCGACIVSVRAKHPIDNKYRTWAVNSCLTPIFSCHGYEITTIEGLGDRVSGYQEIQNRLAKFNGSQCGFCSPGIVMNMYALMQSKNGEILQSEVEAAFDGNVCRCTGYRSILDAFKSMAIDANQSLLGRCADIEDLGKICSKRQSRMSIWSTRSGEVSLEHDGNRSIRLKFDDDSSKEWLKVVSLRELFECLNELGEKDYQLVAGSTANGVYGRNTDVQVFIDINDVVELRSHLVADDNLVFGGGITLADSIEIMLKTATMEGFGYLARLASHVQLIGNVAVRNTGTLAGNLSIKHHNNDFNSDLFLLLETIGAVLYVTNSDKEEDLEEITLTDYLEFDMSKKIILNVILPTLIDCSHHFRSYKIGPSAKPYLIAGFLIEIKDDVINSARICFGGIDPTFVHASATEEYLIDKNVYSNEVLVEALNILSNELTPDENPSNASMEYRKELAVALFFKFILSTMDEDAIDDLQRDISSGVQSTSTSQQKWPITKDVPNVDGLRLAAGEVQFTNDIPQQKNELWAAFVPATTVNARIASIDASEALKIPGVHSFFSANDIPGKNSFTPLMMASIGEEEEIFVGLMSRVGFNGQPCGIILADSFDLANFAATRVKVGYTKIQKNLILTSLKDAFEAKDDNVFIPASTSKEAAEYGASTTRKITGELEIPGQYHFTLEPQTTICVPSQHGLDVYTSTQWPHFTQVAIAEALNVPNNVIRIVQQQNGGSHGAKFTRSAQISCACALASYRANRAVRFVMSLESNMSVVGKRHPCHGDYEVEIDDEGKIQRLKLVSTHDLGVSANDSPQEQMLKSLSNCYNGDAFDVEMRGVRTNTASNTFCVASGTAEGVAFIENIMEHIAWEIKKDPVEVRMANMAEESVMRVILPDFLTECHFYSRQEKIDEFNRDHRWTKRGIAFVPIEYHQEQSAVATVYVSVCHADGTVIVSLDRSDSGHGLHTKVGQFVAHVFGISTNDVKVYQMDLLHAGNTCQKKDEGAVSIYHALREACMEILHRMSKVRNTVRGDAGLRDVAMKCFEQNVDLTTRAISSTGESDPVIWGVTCAEVEVDILTGCFLLKRVDILVDIGESINPGIDVVRMESAYVMGIGHWLSEALKYDRKSGELLTNSTLTYHPPGFRDIPVDFRVKILKSSAIPTDASSEPTLCMAVGAIFALRNAIESARQDAGISKWFQMAAPATPENVFMSSGNSIAEYKLKC